LIFLCIYLGKLDLWLLPLRFPEGNGLREFHILHRDQFNDYYNNAENYLRLALNSTSFASAALLPLIQVFWNHFTTFGIGICNY
jgi:hypothetical protein